MEMQLVTITFHPMQYTSDFAQFCIYLLTDHNFSTVHWILNYLVHNTTCLERYVVILRWLYVLHILSRESIQCYLHCRSKWKGDMEWKDRKQAREKVLHVLCPRMCVCPSAF
jgi:hypothetical protein